MDRAKGLCFAKFLASELLAKVLGDTKANYARQVQDSDFSRHV